MFDSELLWKFLDYFIRSNEKEEEDMNRCIFFKQ